MTDSWDVAAHLAQCRWFRRALRPLILVAAVLALVCAMPASASGADDSDFSLSNLPGVREAGIDLTLWGWGIYAGADQGDDRTSWAGELQLDVTKTFANRVAFSGDFNLYDYDDHVGGNIEQLFVSVLLSRDSGTLLTVGKFNSPFGVEPRDFWDRLTNTPSLLFRAQPQDLRGVMLTVPWEAAALTFRPFVVSGFNDEDSIPTRAAVGLMVEYRPNEKFSFAVTNWFGPGLEAGGDDSESEDEEYGGYAAADSSQSYGSGYSNSVFARMDTWSRTDFTSAESGTLYFLDLQTTWKPRSDLTLEAEYLLGSSRTSDGDLFWDGVMVLANYAFNDHWRVYGQWSYLDDSDGAVTGVDQRLQEVNLGVGYQMNRHVELRAEARRDFSSESPDVDVFSVSASFGY